MVVESTGSDKSLTVVELHQDDCHEGCSKRMFYIIFILIKTFIYLPYSGCVHIYYITAIFYWDVLSHLPTEEKNYTALECSLKWMCALVCISGIILEELSVKQEERLLRLNEVDKVVRRKKNRGKIRNLKKGNTWTRKQARKVIRGQHLHTAFHFPAGLSTLCCEAKHPCKFFSVPCVHMESCHLRVEEKWLISPPQTRSVQVHVTSEDLADSWGPFWSLSCLLWPDINRICEYMNQLWKKASPGKMSMRKSCSFLF